MPSHLDPVARLTLSIFRDAGLSRDDQREVIAIVASALHCDDDFDAFQKAILEAEHDIVAPARDTEDWSKRL